MAQLQPRGPFDQTPQTSGSPDVFEALAGRFGLTVPHEWWPSVHLLKSFEAAGFAHVQIDSPPQGVLRDTRLLTRHAGALRDALATTGLALVVHAPSGLRLGTDEGDRAMDGLIDYAVEARADQIVYHALAFQDEPDAEAFATRESESLRRAVRRAELHGFVISIENLAPLYPGRETISASPSSLRSVVRRIGSECLGVCLDLGHAHISAQLKRTSLSALVAPVLDVVTLIHAHDNFGARLGTASGLAQGIDPLRLDLHLPPGRGDLPWAEVAAPVMRVDAPVILEVHPPFRPRVAELHDTGSLLLATS